MLQDIHGEIINNRREKYDLRINFTDTQLILMACFLI